MGKTRAITVRLEEQDHERLEVEARRLGLTPGALARVFVRTSLDADRDAEAQARRRAGVAAIRGLASLRRRMHDRDPIDVVQLIREGREELDRKTPL